jgi:hypothetical protein
VAALGSISECLLLAKNPLKLPGRFWCRASALLMTDDGWKEDFGLPITSSMSDIHSKLIATAAKAELVPLGFKRKGQSRLWFADHGSWLNIVEFTPSRWSKSVSLMNAAHWLWVGAGFMTYNEAVPSDCHADFETEEQFGVATRKIAVAARRKATEIGVRFPSFEAIADFVVQRARSSPDRMMPSWWGYEAAIASGLVGRTEDARRFFEGLTDDRVSRRAAPLFPLLDRPDDFKSKVNDLVAQERVRLKLKPLASPSF